MKFLLIHAVDEHQDANESECGAGRRLTDWVDEMTARGITIEGARLQPVSDATTFRRDGEKNLVLDGPFAETKEQVAGFDLIECKDMDEALAVAAAHPTTNVGAIEVRPVAPGMPTPDVTEPVEGKRRYLMFVVWDQTGDPEILPSDRDDATGADDTDDPMGGWIEMCGSRRLHGWQLQPPSQAKTVRRAARDHGAHDLPRPIITDGPFAETKEQIGGYDLLECDDLDEALDIVKAHGSGCIEVRPLW